MEFYRLTKILNKVIWVEKKVQEVVEEVDTAADAAAVVDVAAVVDIGTAIVVEANDLEAEVADVEDVADVDAVVEWPQPRAVINVNEFRLKAVTWS